jgi:hypothetical protein
VSGKIDPEKSALNGWYDMIQEVIRSGRDPSSLSVVYDRAIQELDGIVQILKAENGEEGKRNAKLIEVDGKTRAAQLMGNSQSLIFFKYFIVKWFSAILRDRCVDSLYSFALVE